MDDIVKRARDHAAALEKASLFTPNFTAALLTELADEVERLRGLFAIDGEMHASAIRDARQEQQVRVAAYAAEIDRLKGEVVRLREALTAIRDGHIPDAPMASNDDELLWAQRWVGTLRRIAFDALTGEQGD